MSRVLLLNADWSPLKFITDIRALNLLLKGRAEIIHLNEMPSVWDEYFNTPTTSYQVPATIRLVDRVNVSYTAPRFRKWVLYNRDGWLCQYCKKSLNWGSVTIDHVVPKSRGGKTTWKNCVVSCKGCNRKKGPLTPHEAGMNLIKQPSEPKLFHFWDLRDTKVWHRDWGYFVSIKD